MLPNCLQQTKLGDKAVLHRNECTKIESDFLKSHLSLCQRTGWILRPRSTQDSATTVLLGDSARLSPPDPATQCLNAYP